MRWERARALPVRRLAGGAKAAIYALKSELDASLTRPAGESPSFQGTAPGSPASIAVLPFASLSAEKETEYFADGLADEILNLLTRIPNLRVTARTSSFRVRGRSADVRTLGASLGVTTLLEGSVQRAAGRVRVSAQLVETRTGYHLWSERFDREMSDSFAIQEEIARAVTEALRLTIAPHAFPPDRRPSNPQAYNAWLKGRSYQYGRRSLETLQKARECFEQAIALDPAFARAHLGLAEHFRDMSFLGLTRPAEAAAKGKHAAARAVEVDASLGEQIAQAPDHLGRCEPETPPRVGVDSDTGRASSHRARRPLAPRGITTAGH
jgi:TolB-like protein